METFVFQNRKSLHYFIEDIYMTTRYLFLATQYRVGTEVSKVPGIIHPNDWKELIDDMLEQDFIPIKVNVEVTLA
jgi:hypothetical protein